MKRLKLPIFHWAKLLSILFFILLLGAYSNILAIGQKYNPGDTLDPACSPGEVNCTVLISSGGSSQWTTSGNDIYYNTGKVGVGTDTPTSSLTVKSSVETTGSDLVTNGTFNTDSTGWNLYDSGSYDNGKLTVNYTGAEGWADLSTDINTESGKKYIVTFTLSNVTNDTVYFYLSNNSFSEDFNDDAHGDGTYSVVFTADDTGTDTIRFELWNWNNNSTFSIDDVSIKEVSNIVPSLNVLDVSGNNIVSFGSVDNPDSLLLGINAGKDITNVSNSNFFGNSAGYQATSAQDSNFLGNQAGYQATNAWESNFFGVNSGYLATSAYGSNFMGGGTGIQATNASFSNFIGHVAGQYATNASNSNFIGFGTGQQATNASNSNFLGNGTGFLATNAHDSNFLGNNSGNNASLANDSNFFGYFSGLAATNASYSNFLGKNTGLQATNASNSNFLGNGTGFLATNAHDSNFLGYQSGQYSHEAMNSNFLGNQAGYYSVNASNSNFLGNQAGYQASNSSYSNFLGNQAGYQSGAPYSNFLGYKAGYQAAYASNSIFIGQNAGLSDTVYNIGNNDDFSILIGKDTSTGGNENSIAIGGSAVNTVSNQLSFGSATRPINYLYIAGVNYTLPTSQGASNTYLKNDGSGVLTWASAGGDGGSSQWTTSGNDIYYNDGKVGIGTDSPTATLSVNGNASVTGSELVTNGTFDTNSNSWNLYDSSTYNGGKLSVSYTGTEDWADVSTSVSTESGKKYLITFTISDLNNDTVYVYFDNNSYESSDYGAGKNSIVFTSDYTGTDTIYFENYYWNDNSSWSIDNVSIKEISTTPNTALEVYNFNGNKVLSLGNSTDTISIGNDAGLGSSTSPSSLFVGNHAGLSTSNSQYSNFIGDYSGYNVDNGDYSNFFGPHAGENASNVGYSNFFGIWAGRDADGSGSSNFFGPSAGSGSTNSGRSNFIGQWAGFNADNADTSNFIGSEAGSETTGASKSNFLGYRAGYQALTASRSNFFGDTAGYQASVANGSNFLGSQAGYTATNASYSNFLGQIAGSGATGASFSNFFGFASGILATNSHDSNFLGNSAGYSSTNAFNSNFFGTNSGYEATNASNSNFIGYQAGGGTIDYGAPNDGAYNAANSIFIGTKAGFDDTVNNTGNANDFSILLGNNTNTGGFSNSIAIGGSAANTASNQLMLGSSTRPINTTVWNGTGSVTCTFTTAIGAMTCASDINLKKNILDLNNMTFNLREDINVSNLNTLDKLLTLTPVTYNWNYEQDTDQAHMGFIAQEVEQIFPSLVYTDENSGLKSLNTTGLTPYIVKAIQEMDLKVKDIGDMEIENTWRDSIVAWLSNATNKITRIFTGEICLTEAGQDPVCINRSELQSLKTLLNTTQSDPGTNIEINNTPTDTPAIDQPILETTTPPSEPQPPVIETLPQEPPVSVPEETVAPISEDTQTQ